jgi:hypothetical protein
LGDKPLVSEVVLSQGGTARPDQAVALLPSPTTTSSRTGGSVRSSRGSAERVDATARH